MKYSVERTNTVRR